MSKRIITILNIKSSVLDGMISYQTEPIRKLYPSYTSKQYKTISVKITSNDIDEAFSKLKYFLIDFRNNFFIGGLDNPLDSKKTLNTLITQTLFNIYLNNLSSNSKKYFLSINYEVFEGNYDSEVFDIEI